jgi:putative endonuclease
MTPSGSGSRAGRRRGTPSPNREAPVPEWSVYIVRCRDGSLYTGIATDVARRLAEHADGRGARYLRGRGPLRLELERRVGSRAAAQSVEARIKRLSRREKERLLRGGELPGA